MRGAQPLAVLGDVGFLPLVLARLFIGPTDYEFLKNKGLGLVRLGSSALCTFRAHSSALVIILSALAFHGGSCIIRKNASLAFYRLFFNLRENKKTPGINSCP